MYFFITLSTAVALSLDAFSLAIIYGTVLKEKSVRIILSSVVGIFHFFMPLLGYLMSNLLLLKIIPNTNILSFIIFSILGIEMLTSKNEEGDLMNLASLANILLFAFTVSLDSFSVGIAISARKEAILIPMIIFSIVSCFFTYLGLLIGKRATTIFGKYTNKIGGIILIILSFYYLFT